MTENEQTTLLRHALAYYAAGMSLIPVLNDGSKKQALTSWNPYREQRASEEQILDWLVTNGYQGYAVVCGPVSGNLYMIELEGRAVHEGLDVVLADIADASGLENLWGRLQGTLTQQSPSGGLHYVIHVDGTAPGNRKLARRRIDERTVHCLAETRGDGGYFIGAGSTVHETGIPWTIRSGSASSIATFTNDELEVILDLFAALDEMPAKASEPSHESTRNTTDGTRPGDDYNARTHWKDILEGWAAVFTRGGVTYWRRPGKHIGVSATTGRNNADNLWVFSSSTAFEPERPYSKFAAYCLLEHNGDFAAAASELARQGYGTPPTVPVNAHSATQGAPSAAPTPEGQPMTDTLPAFTATDTLALSEDGHAQHLIAEFGTTIRYWEDRGRWLHWDGWRWREQPGGGGIVREYAKFIARSYPDDKQWLSHKRRCLSAAGTSACLAQASTDHRVTVSTEALDAHPWELNTPGGIIDLRSGSLMPPDPAKLHTRITRCAPDYTADRHAWLGFLDTTFQGDAELIEWMQRLLGYAALGVVLENILPVFYGATGANGKTVLLDTVMAILGDYAAPAPKGFLLAGAPKHDTEIADLAGVRMIVSSETNTGERFDEGKVKLLTGGDRLKARFMRQDYFHFTPSHTVFLMSNHRPEVTAGGSAFWRRIREVPFDHQVPKELRDGTLKDRLVNDHGPAILAWIAEGAAKYAVSGLAEPARVDAATSDYERDTDTVARFVEDVCILGGGEHVKVLGSLVRSAYEAWCRSEGETPVSAKALNQALRGRYALGNVKSHGSRFYTNLTLAQHDQEAEVSSCLF